MAAITGLLVLFGNMLGGTGGMVIALLLAAGLNFGTYWFSDKLVLKMVKAAQLSPKDAPEFFAMVEDLTNRADLPMPALYIVEDPSPNAFATGRNPQNAAVAVNRGLIELLDQDEVAGVVAHELAHIKNRDTLTMAIVSTLAGAITMLATLARFAFIFGGFGGGDNNERSNPFALLFMALVAPVAALIIQMAVSRTREFEADKVGAQIAGTPSGLANALMKLERGTQVVPTRTDAAHANMYIVNPLKAGGIMNLFRTHPPVEERINRLRAMNMS